MLLAVATGACTNRNTWRPTIDPYNDPNAERLGIDEAQCRQLANQGAGGTGSEAAKQGVTSGLLGAATGAAIGAIFGDAGAGAATGAAAGVFGGSARGAGQSDADFKRMFSNCMRQRGHNVLN